MMSEPGFMGFVSTQDLSFHAILLILKIHVQTFKTLLEISFCLMSTSLFLLFYY